MLLHFKAKHTVGAREKLERTPPTSRLGSCSVGMAEIHDAAATRPVVIVNSCMTCVGGLWYWYMDMRCAILVKSIYVRG